MGFSSAYACSPPEPEYFYEDPISEVNIYMIEEGSDELINITDKFLVDNYLYGENNEVSVEELFPIEDEDYYTWYDNFNVELTNYENIPNKVNFKIEVNLESGNSYTETTELIQFAE